MKILLHCDEYDPRHVPIAIRMSVFSQLFRQKGHEVQVLTGAHLARAHHDLPGVVGEQGIAARQHQARIKQAQARLHAVEPLVLAPKGTPEI